MDMRKYSASSFISFDDVRDGPRKEKIVNVVIGNYDRPVLLFESGDQLSVNKTNVKVLIKAYGENGQDWVGCIIELYPGLTVYNGQQTDSVLIKPITPEKKLKERTAPPKRPEPEPPDALDDGIPY